MLVALLAPLAFAAEILVLADGPVSVEVDGRPVRAAAGARGVTAADLAGGAHRVDVFDDRQRLLASATVDVAVTDQLRLELRRGVLAELGRGPLPNAATCPPPAPGDFQLTGIAQQDVAVWVDGKPVQAGPTGFVARGLADGTHDLRVVQGRRTLHAGNVRIRSELVRRCVPIEGGLDCVYDDELVAVPPPAPPAPPPPTRVVMSDAEFAAFLGGVERASFSSDKLRVVSSATGWFTIAQVGQIVDALAHSSDKVEAVGILAPRVVDRQNAWKLQEHFSFSSDRETVAALFR